jgi:hypothetical protein
MVGPRPIVRFDEPARIAELKEHIVTTEKSLNQNSSPPISAPKRLYLGKNQV